MCKSALGELNSRGYANNVAEERTAKRKRAFGVFYLVAIGTLSLMALATLLELVSGQSAKQPGSPAILRVMDVYNEYARDFDAADALYKTQQQQRFGGVALAVVKEETGEHRMLVDLLTGSEEGSVPALAYFSVDQEAEILAIQAGQRIAFEGKLQGMGEDGRLRFRDCTLVRGIPRSEGIRP
jgi:hypothetical protein